MSRTNLNSEITKCCLLFLNFPPILLSLFFFLPFCFTAFTIQFSSLLQQRSSTEVIYGKQEPGQKGYRTLLTLSVALAPLSKLACQSPSNVCIACATGHTSCVSPVQTLSDMQQILPEQQPKKKKKVTRGSVQLRQVS